MNGQFAEVLVQSHQDAALVLGTAENLLVPRVLCPLAGPRDVMPKGHERVAGRLRDAGIEEHPQDRVPTSSGSMRSCATRRFA